MTPPGPFAHWQRAIQPRDLPAPPPPGESGLPPTFQFSQNNLQDYVDCARRFQLRYFLGQRWPAPEIEPMDEYEHYLEQGAQFHLLIQRHLLGIPAEKLTPRDPLLREWWENYLAHPIPDLPAEFREPEVQLSALVGEQRLMARFDLLAIDPGQRAVIVDWKTTRRRPNRQTLAERLQSRVYPFVLAEAGAPLFGGPIRPEHIKLIYWFAGEPGKPEIFGYTAARHHENREFLTGLIARVAVHRETVWPLTDNLDHCQYCVYRSLCDRGVKAGPLEGAVSLPEKVDFDLEFRLDDVDEIAF